MYWLMTHRENKTASSKHIMGVYIHVPSLRTVTNLLPWYVIMYMQELAGIRVSDIDSILALSY